MLRDMEIVSYARPLHQKLLRAWRKQGKQFHEADVLERAFNDAPVAINAGVRWGNNRKRLARTIENLSGKSPRLTQLRETIASGDNIGRRVTKSYRPVTNTRARKNLPGEELPWLKNLMK